MLTVMDTTVVSTVDILLWPVFIRYKVNNMLIIVSSNLNSWFISSIFSFGLVLFFPTQISSSYSSNVYMDHIGKS